MLKDLFCGMTKLIITLLLCVLFLTLSGQKYSAVWLTTDDGLPQNSVKDMVKDRYGYLWISTERGVIRYDGNGFTSFDVHGLSNLHFMTFSGDRKKDSIVISTDGRRDAIMIRKRKVLRLPYYRKKDGIYFRGKYYEYYEKSNLGDPSLKMYYTVSTRTGTYLFSKNKIVFRKAGSPAVEILLSFDPNNMKDVFSIDELVFIRNTKHGNIIMIENGRVQHLEHPMFADPEAIIYWEKINRQVFLIHKDVIYTVSYTNNKISLRKLMNYKNFRNYQFYSMYYDRDYKILYLGSLTRGLLVLKHLIFYAVKNNISSEPPTFTSLLPYTRSSVLTPEGVVFDSSRILKRIRFDSKNFPNSMLYDNRGNLICFKDSTLRIYPPSMYRPILRHVFRFYIFNVLRAGDFYFLNAFHNNQYVLMEFADHTYSKVKRKFITRQVVECIQRCDPYSYVAGCADGLYVLDVRHLTFKKISHIPVKNICRTRDGNLWAMSFANGFYLIKNKKLIRMPMDRDNNLSTPHDLQEDRRGFLWISTNNGLYRIHRKILLEYSDTTSHINKEVHYYRYSKKDGFNTNEFNGGGQPGSAALANGQFAFPSMDGVVFFRPESVPAVLPYSGSISAERLKVGDSIRFLNDTLYLKKDYHRAELYIDIPFYGQKENLVLEAQIDSTTDKKWNVIGDDRVLVLEKLPSGSHVLYIRSWIGNGKYTYKTLSFYIQPYFYETVWFRILTGAIIITTMVAVIRWSYRRFSTQKKIIQTVTDRLEQTEMILENETSHQENLFQAITHDIATPIKHLSNLSQMMLDTDSPALQKKYFDSVYKSTEELYNLAMSLREYREAISSNEIFAEKAYSLHEAIERKIKLFADMSEYNATKIINTIDQDLVLSVKESIINIIIQNLLDNAVKNTAGGTIVFKGYREYPYIVIMLTDTGKGMPDEKLNYYNTLYQSNDEDETKFRNLGLGLHLVIRLVKKINAIIEFRKQTQGTLVIIKIIDICSKEF